MAFRLAKAVVPVSLPPSRLRRPQEGVTAGVDEYLNSLLLTYVTQLDGVVISYRRVAIHGEPLGCINGLYPFVNFKVDAEFVVFSPQVGSHLVGQITKVGPDLINVLVHGLFSVILEKDDVPEGYSYNPATDTWIALDEGQAAPVVVEKKGGLSKTARKKLAKEQAKAVEVAQTSDRPPLAPEVWLKFSILRLDANGKIYQWKASARGEGLGPVEAQTPLHESLAAKGEEVAAEAPAEGGEGGDEPEQSLEDSMPKKGRKKKQRVL